MKHWIKLLKASAVAVGALLLQITACSVPVFVGFSPPGLRHHLSGWDVAIGVAEREDLWGVALLLIFFFVVAISVAYFPRKLRQGIALIAMVVVVATLAFIGRVIYKEVHSDARISYPFWYHEDH